MQPGAAPPVSGSRASPPRMGRRKVSPLRQDQLAAVVVELRPDTCVRPVASRPHVADDYSVRMRLFPSCAAPGGCAREDG